MNRMPSKHPLLSGCQAGPGINIAFTSWKDSDILVCHPVSGREVPVQWVEKLSSAQS